MLNHINIMGRIVKEFELLKTGNGRSYCHFRIACDRDRTGRDGEKITDFLDATAWGSTAEFIHKYFAKGDPILLDGSIYTTSWKDRNGNARYGVEINVNDVYFCGSKRRSGPTEAAPVLTELDNDGTELPFASDDDGKAPWDEGELPF